MMKRENLVLDTMCFRIFVLKLRKWRVQGSVGPRPMFERELPLISLAEAPTRFENLRTVLQALEVEVEDVQSKFNNNMVPVGAEDTFFSEADLLEIADVYGYDSPLETLVNMDCPQLVPIDKLDQVVRRFKFTKVFTACPFETVFPNSSGWHCTVKGVEYFTDTHLPEDERFIPTGFAIIGH